MASDYELFCTQAQEALEEIERIKNDELLKGFVGGVGSAEAELKEETFHVLSEIGNKARILQDSLNNSVNYVRSTALNLLNKEYVEGQFHLIQWDYHLPASKGSIYLHENTGTALSEFDKDRQEDIKELCDIMIFHLEKAKQELILLEDLNTEWHQIRSQAFQEMNKEY